MAYRVEFERRAAKELAALPAPIRTRIIKALDKLAANPRHAQNVKALHGGGLPDARGRLPLLVVKIGHRQDVYRGT